MRRAALAALALVVGVLSSPGADIAPDFFAEGNAAQHNGDLERAVSLFAQEPESDPHFVEAMIEAGRYILADTLNEPERGLLLAERALHKSPDSQEAALAVLRCQLLARTNLISPWGMRDHPAKVPDQFKFIAAAPAWPDKSRKFPKAELIADLDQLEVLVANAYSYADRRGADWRGALDAVRASLDEETGIDTFAWRLGRFITIFGDAHSSVEPPVSDFIPVGTIPFLPIAQGERVLAIQPDRMAFLDPDFPYLQAIDGLPLGQWLAVAAFDVPQGSPQLRRRYAVAGLRQVNYLRAQLGLAPSNSLTLRLASEDGLRQKDLTVNIPDQTPHVSGWPRTATQIRDGMGVLRLASMQEDSEFLRGLDDTMSQFRDTHGLVIDVRENGGGSQDALRTLLPYFMSPGAPMKIVNVAAYKIPSKLDHVPAEGFLPRYRWLYPVTSPYWTASQHAEVQSFLRDFHAKWRLPAGFSDWHVMGISRESNPRAYYYSRPVVVLCDAGSFSATDNFLGAFKGHPNVTLLGMPSGGGSGRMTDYHLPNTKLKVVLCQMASFRAGGELFDGKGVTPDVWLEPKPTDHLKHGDSVLEAAIELLKKRASLKNGS